jgi:hypothetical protein
MSEFERGFDAGFKAARGKVPDPDERAAGSEEEPLTVEAIKAMTSAEINARWDEIEPILTEAAHAR